MDRHDLPDSMTPETLAKLHRQDLKIEQQFGCRGFTYWYDHDKKIAFCLVEAPNKKAIQDMHNSSHGDVPHSIIEVDDMGLGVIVKFTSIFNSSTFTDSHASSTSSGLLQPEEFP